MRPIKNTAEHSRYFAVGDYVKEGWHTGRVTELVACTDAARCKELYHNFHICGGFRRILEGVTSACPFFIAVDSDSFLSISPNGNKVI